MSVLPTLSVEGVINRWLLLRSRLHSAYSVEKVRRIETVYVVPFNP